MKRNEFFIVVVLVSLSAGLISNLINVPTKIDNLLSGSFGKTVLVILALYAFSISPAVGLSATLLTAVLIFSHNVSFINNLQTSNPLYDNTISNFVRNLFTPSSIDGKLTQNENAEYAEMIETVPAEGSYPSNESRVSHYTSTLEYNYRPQEDTGSDEFNRYGPNIDEKLDVLNE